MASSANQVITQEYAESHYDVKNETFVALLDSISFGDRSNALKARCGSEHNLFTSCSGLFAICVLRDLENMSKIAIE